MDSFVFFSFLFRVCPSMWCVFLTWAHDRSSHQFHTTSQADPPAYRLALPCSSFNNRRIERVTRPFLFFCSLHVNRETIEQQQPPNIMKERKKIIIKRPFELLSIYTVRINAAVSTWHTNIGLVSCICLEDDGRHVRAALLLPLHHQNDPLYSEWHLKSVTNWLLVQYSQHSTSL